MKLRQISASDGSRRARLPLVLSGALLASALTVLGGDRLVAAWAEHRAAQAFQQATGAASAPGVRISGFPVTGQVLAGHLHRVDIHARHIPAAGDHPVPLTRLDLSMTDVHAYANAHTARASTVTGTALLSYADLSDALGVGISADTAPGRITARTQIPLLGDVSASARPTVAGPTSIAFRDVRLDAHLPAAAYDAVVQALQQPVTLQDLPAGMTLADIRVDARGVRGDVTGQDVTFAPDQAANTSARSV